MTRAVLGSAGLRARVCSTLRKCSKTGCLRIQCPEDAEKGRVTSGRDRPAHAHAQQGNTAPWGRKLVLAEGKQNTNRQKGQQPLLTGTDTGTAWVRHYSFTTGDLPGGPVVKNPLLMRRPQVQSLVWKIPRASE